MEKLRNTSEVLKEERKEMHLTQKEMAELIGISTATLAMYETGNRNPNPVIKKKICELFSCDMNYIDGYCLKKKSYDYGAAHASVSIFNLDNMGKPVDVFNLPDTYGVTVPEGVDSFRTDGIEPGDVLLVSQFDNATSNIKLVQFDNKQPELVKFDANSSMFNIISNIAQSSDSGIDILGNVCYVLKPIK